VRYKRCQRAFEKEAPPSARQKLVSILLWLSFVALGTWLALDLVDRGSSTPVAILSGAGGGVCLTWFYYVAGWYALAALGIARPPQAKRSLA
jgi:hypothetical protein